MYPPVVRGQRREVDVIAVAGSDQAELPGAGIEQQRCQALSVPREALPAPGRLLVVAAVQIGEPGDRVSLLSWGDSCQVTSAWNMPVPPVPNDIPRSPNPCRTVFHRFSPGAPPELTRTPVLNAPPPLPISTLWMLKLR